MKIRFLLKVHHVVIGTIKTEKKVEKIYGKKKGADYPIYLALYDRDQTEIIYTGQRCKVSEWSKKDRIPKDVKGDLYTEITDVKNAVEKVMKRMKADDKVITPFQLKAEYDAQQKAKYLKQHSADKKEKESLTSITGLIKKWIDTGMSEYLPSTKRTITISINQFKEYLKISGNLKLEKKDLTPDLIHEYAINFLQEKRKLSDSTHAKRMKHLRLFLKWANIDTAIIKDIKIRSIKPSERNIISLTKEELERLEAVDVSFDYEWQRSKDMFLLGCYTGLRVSDLKRISRHKIENGCINITLQKNRKNVSIPVLKQTKAILEKYDMQAPKISEQQVNDGIKKVCEKAGINKMTEFKSKRKGVLIEKKYPKHELITTHVAGKTFISLAPDKWGFTPADVAAFVGKDIKTVLGYYLRPDQESAINKMLEVESRAKMRVS